MIKLLKTDLIRIFKDKLFLVLSIIGLAFAVLTPVIYKLTFLLLKTPTEDLAFLGLAGKEQFFAAFSTSNNFGLIAPILIAIILFKDFSQGTVRNKIICGNSRSKIFFSMLISCLISLFAVVFAHALITLALSSAFFGYQQSAFTFADFGYLALSVFFELLVYVFIASLVCFLCVWAKNMGVTILMLIATTLLSGIFSGVTLMAQMFVNPDNQFAQKAWEFASKINVMSSTLIGNGTTYTTGDVLYIVIPALAFSAIMILASLLVFNKKDLK